MPVHATFPRSSNSARVCEVAELLPFGSGPGFDASPDSSRRFNILNSLIATSSKPRVTSLPTKTDIPFSIWRAGNPSPAIFEACKVRKHAKPILQHSAVGLHPAEMIDAEEDDLLSRPDMLGELDTRFRDRACEGDCGNEFERRRACLAEALTKSFEYPCRLAGAAMGALIASLRDFRVTFMTSVANIDFSRDDNCSPPSCVLSSSTTAFLNFVEGVFPVLCFANVADLGALFVAAIDLIFWLVFVGNKSSLSVVAVAGVQVDVEQIAARIESAVA